MSFNACLRWEHTYLTFLHETQADTAHLAYNLVGYNARLCVTLAWSIFKTESSWNSNVHFCHVDVVLCILWCWEGISRSGQKQDDHNKKCHWCTDDISKAAQMQNSESVGSWADWWCLALLIWKLFGIVIVSLPLHHIHPPPIEPRAMFFHSIGMHYTTLARPFNNNSLYQTTHCWWFSTASSTNTLSHLLRTIKSHLKEQLEVSASMDVMLSITSACLHQRHRKALRGCWNLKCFKFAKCSPWNLKLVEN